LTNCEPFRASMSRPVFSLFFSFDPDIQKLLLCCGYSSVAYDGKPLSDESSAFEWTLATTQCSKLPG
jgi:hypothetical protein